MEFVSWFDAAAFANAVSVAAGRAQCYAISEVRCVRDGADDPARSDPSECWTDVLEGIDSAVVEPDGVASVYDCSGYRLPTESEWEYAARAGSDTDIHTSFANNGSLTHIGKEPVDPNLTRIGWYGGNSGSSSSSFDCSGWYPGASTCGPHPVGRRAANDWGLFDMSGNVWEWTWDRAGSYPDGTEQDPLVDPAGPDFGARRAIRGGNWYERALNCRSANRFDLSAPGDRPVNGLGFRLVRTLR